MSINRLFTYLAALLVFCTFPLSLYAATPLEISLKDWVNVFDAGKVMQVNPTNKTIVFSEKVILFVDETINNFHYVTKIRSLSGDTLTLTNLTANKYIAVFGGSYYDSKTKNQYIIAATIVVLPKDMSEKELKKLKIPTDGDLWPIMKQ